MRTDAHVIVLFVWTACVHDVCRWYDKVMRADAYVIGSTVFSLEISGC